MNINRECKWCKSEGKCWDSDDKKRWGSTSNLWTHLEEKHDYFCPGKELKIAQLPQGQQRLPAFIQTSGNVPTVEITLADAIVELFVDTQSPFEMIENKKFKQMMRVATKGESLPIRSV
jgi:hypothetical protein